MFEYRKYLLLVATATMMAACGGGGGDAPSATLPDRGSEDGDNTDDDGNGDGQAADQVLQGRLVVVGNSLLYVRHNRNMYLPVTIERFEDPHGINDVASGFVSEEEIGDPYPEGTDGTKYAPSHTYAPSAPIAAFGIRVDKRVQRIDATDIVTNQNAVGRIAVELVERTEKPEWVSSGQWSQRGQAEIVRYVINNVELSTNEIGELSAKVLPGAQMQVYGRNAAGDEVRETVPVREDAVSMLPMDRVPDQMGDNTSIVLLLDFEKAFSQAGNRLAALNNVGGYFDMRVTLSSVEQLIRPARCPLTLKDLKGDDITIEGQPTVKGAGVRGYAWIRAWDPVPPPDQGYGEGPTCPDDDSGSEPAGEAPEGPVTQPETPPEQDPTTETEV